KQVVGAKDYSTGAKIPVEALNIEVAEERPRFRVELRDPSGGRRKIRRKITEIGNVQRMAEAADATTGCKRAVWITVPAELPIAGDKRVEKIACGAAELEDLTGKVYGPVRCAHVLVGDIEAAPRENEAPWSTQAAAAGCNEGAQISAGLRIEAFHRIIRAIADIEGIGSGPPCSLESRQDQRYQE